MAVTLYWLTLNAYHEARGEPDAGIKAVTKVVLNRVRRRKMTVKQVIFQNQQFSWTQDDIPNYVIKDTDAYKKCRRLTEEAIDEYINGECLNGADHYFNFHQVQPVWMRNMVLVCRIGNHAFYRS